MMHICPGDIANPQTAYAEGIVNVYDLFNLLSNWDTDGPGAALASPTNIVDCNDLFVLLAHWDCRVGNPYQAETLEQAVTNAGLTMNDWNEFVDVMENSEDEGEKANYNCWMKNYLSACTTCPSCSGKDPFE